MQATTLDDLLRSAQRRALHLEMRDSYGGSAAFDAWQTGEPHDRSVADQRWAATLAPFVGRGGDLRRARIVSEPVTAYIRFEYEVTPLANLAAGELVRWLPRRHASAIALPGNDFWLVDDIVLFNHFSGDGVWVDVELSTANHTVALCERAFHDVWAAGTEHHAYQPA